MGGRRDRGWSAIPIKFSTGYLPLSGRIEAHTSTCYSDQERLYRIHFNLEGAVWSVDTAICNGPRGALLNHLCGELRKEPNANSISRYRTSSSLDVDSLAVRLFLEMEWRGSSELQNRENGDGGVSTW